MDSPFAFSPADPPPLRLEEGEYQIDPLTGEVTTGRPLESDYSSMIEFVPPRGPRFLIISEHGGEVRGNETALSIGAAPEYLTVTRTAFMQGPILPSPCDAKITSGGKQFHQPRDAPYHAIATANASARIELVTPISPGPEPCIPGVVVAEYLGLHDKP